MEICAPACTSVELLYESRVGIEAIARRQAKTLGRCPQAQGGQAREAILKATEEEETRKSGIRNENVDNLRQILMAKLEKKEVGRVETQPGDTQAEWNRSDGKRAGEWQGVGTNKDAEEIVREYGVKQTRVAAPGGQGLERTKEGYGDTLSAQRADETRAWKNQS